MPELRDLYQDVILEHSKRPRNYRTLDAANHKAEGFNPLCGDKLSLELKLEDDRIQDARFVGCGCAISTASAPTRTIISGLNHTARSLAVYASQGGLPHHHARLASGWLASLSGRD